MKIDIRNFSKNDVEIVQDFKVKFSDKKIAEYYPEQSRIRVLVDRFGNDYRLKVHLETDAYYICDSCLEPYIQKISLDSEHIFQVGQGELALSEDVELLPADATEIDISELLREMIIINHPIKMKCSSDCRGLCPECGVNLNKESCSCADGKVDPRWESLRKLIK